jgi:hypothetical protein
LIGHQKDEMDHFRGGVVPQLNRHTTQEAEVQLTGVSKNRRTNLMVTGLAKLKNYAEKGLDAKFGMMVLLVGKKASKDQLKSIYLITMRIEEFRKAFQAYDMEDIFTIVSEYVLEEDT